MLCSIKIDVVDSRLLSWIRGKIYLVCDFVSACFICMHGQNSTIAPLVSCNIHWYPRVIPCNQIFLASDVPLQHQWWQLCKSNRLSPYTGLRSVCWKRCGGSLIHRLVSRLKTLFTAHLSYMHAILWFLLTGAQSVVSNFVCTGMLVHYWSWSPFPLKILWWSCGWKCTWTPAQACWVQRICGASNCLSNGEMQLTSLSLSLDSIRTSILFVMAVGQVSLITI